MSLQHLMDEGPFPVSVESELGAGGRPASATVGGRSFTSFGLLGLTAIRPKAPLSWKPRSCQVAPLSVDLKSPDPGPFDGG